MSEIGIVAGGIIGFFCGYLTWLFFGEKIIAKGNHFVEKISQYTLFVKIGTTVLGGLIVTFVFQASSFLLTEAQKAGPIDTFYIFLPVLLFDSKQNKITASVVCLIAYLLINLKELLDFYEKDWTWVSDERTLQIIPFLLSAAGTFYLLHLFLKEKG